MTVRTTLFAALALSACTRSAPPPAPSPTLTADGGPAATIDAASVAPPRTSPPNAALERVPVALALEADGALLVLVRRQPRARDEEIVPTLGALSAAMPAGDGLCFGATPSTVISLTPEHELLRWRDGRWNTVPIAPEAASLALLGDGALVALSRDQPAAAQRWTGARWEPVEPALRSLLAARAGEGALAQPIDPSSIAVASGVDPAALFLRCADATHRWRDGACAPHALASGATLSGDGDLVAVPAARATIAVLLRPQCAEEGATLCALDAHVFNGPSLAPARGALRLGQVAMDEQHNPGWYAARAVEGALIAGWRARSTDARPAFSLRFARMDAAGRRWATLPAIAAESAPTALAYGGAPLTVVWTHESEPSTWSISTLSGPRFTTALAPQLNGTLVDAAITQSPAGPIVTLLALDERRRAVLLRREPSREWQTTELPSL